MGDPLKEHALHLLNAISDRDVLPDIIKILERKQHQQQLFLGLRPNTPSSLQDAFSQSFQTTQMNATGSSGPGTGTNGIPSNANNLFFSSPNNFGGGAGGFRPGSPSNLLESPSLHPQTDGDRASAQRSDDVHDADGMDLLSLNAKLGNELKGGQQHEHETREKVAQPQGRRAAVSAMPMSTNDIAAFVPPVIDKAEEDTLEVRKAVAAVHLFSSMDNDEREVIVKAMDREEFDSGIDILTQGKPSVNRFYVIISGTVSIIKSGKQVATIESGNSFGELEMMYDAQEMCAATVHAVTPVVCYFLDRQTFKNIVLKATLDKRSTYLQMLQNVPFLRGMSQYDKATLADVLQRADYKPDEPIIRFAERGNWMHIIIEGEVKVVGRDSGRKVEIVRLGKGDPVGELEFLFNHPAVADVIAVTDVRTAKMNRKHFEMCMGPIADNLKLYITEGNYQHYMKHADKSVLGEISAAEQKLKRTKVATGAEGNVIASSSVDSKGEIVVLDDHTIVYDGSDGSFSSAGNISGASNISKGGAKKNSDDDDSPSPPPSSADRNKYMYRFPLRAVHQQNTVIIGVREDGVILSWNDAAARLTNYSVDDTLGQSIYSLIKRQSDQKELYDLIHETSKWAGNVDAYFQKFVPKSSIDSRLPSVHCVFSRRDGLTHSHLALTCVPGIIAQPKHIPEMILLVGTEQKQVIQDKDLDYGDWIVEQMRETLGSHKGEMCEKAAIEKLLNEYELLRHRSRTIDKGQLHALNPRQLLGQVVSSLQHDAVLRDNEVSSDFGPEVPEQLFCDTELLPEVLRVALHNCVKHNSGSTIKIHVGIVQDRGIEYLEIAFEDNGPGIPAGEIKAFEKPNINPKSQYANSGLVKLKAAVGRLGGTMSVESVPNHTRLAFRIQYLPSEDDFLAAGTNFAAAAASAGGGSAASGTGVAGSNSEGESAASGGGDSSQQQQSHVNRTYTTLVAEEHAVNRNALCSFLWNRKHAVVPAHSTADFLRLVDSCDIVIIDPEQNLIDSSVDIFSLLQRLERNKAVVVSGQNVTDETREAHRKAGFITLSKPYSPVASVAAIRKAEETVNRVKAEQEKVAAMRATFQRTNRGEWTKGALLGKGAFGDVYESIDVLTGGKMAVKMMRITKNQNKQDLINEIEVMCTLRHPNIIHYFYCEDVPEEGRINIFMEFAGGGTLNGKLEKLNRAMTMQEMRPILVDIVEGIKYIHSRRFVHCDLKTPNILFGHDGRGKIGDFGTARQLAEGQKLYNMAGTFQYMSPECMGADAEEQRGYDYAADIWSIGCIALELATGKMPWTHLPCKGNGMPLIAYMTELTEEQGSPDLSNIFDAPPPVFEFIRACLEIGPDKRPTAAALLDFTLLRGNFEDDDAATAIRALAKAKLIHQLNQFVAFSEPVGESSLNGGGSSGNNNNNNNINKDGGGSGGNNSHGASGRNRRQSMYERGFFDSDEDELPSAAQRTPSPKNPLGETAVNNDAAATASPDGKRGGFCDSSSDDDEDDVDDDDDNNDGGDDGENGTTKHNNNSNKNKNTKNRRAEKHEDAEKSPPHIHQPQQQQALAALVGTPATPAPAKKKKEFWEDTSEDDDDAKKNGKEAENEETSTNQQQAHHHTNQNAHQTRVPSAPHDPKPPSASPHHFHHRRGLPLLGAEDSSAISKDASGALAVANPTSSAAESGDNEKNHHNNNNNNNNNTSTGIEQPGADRRNADAHSNGEVDNSSNRNSSLSAKEVQACSMAIHGKLLQLLSKVTESLHLEGRFTVNDPLQEQYNAAVSPVKAQMMASSRYAEEEGRPFVPNVTSLLRSHVEQLDKFLEQLEEQQQTAI